MSNWCFSHFAIVVAATIQVLSCNQPYRIGEHVWVDLDGPRYRAFIVDRASSGRFRVQFEGCDTHWQRDVTLEKIVGRLDETEAQRAPSVVACSPVGVAAKGAAGGLATPYKVGDRIRVRWRGSVYTASVAGVMAPDRFLVHYEGHEAAWDEVVPLERVEGPR